jgi:choline dehydrogenase-like flavoprotein
MLGCAYNRKVNAAGAFLKAAVENGLTVVANTSVQRFSGSRDHFVVHGSSAAGPVRVRCRRVVVAASAIETPTLLRRSGARSNLIGSRLRLHPSAIVYAQFDQRVEAWRGVPQAVLVNAFASFEQNGRGGFLLLCNPANVPALVAVTAPGTGAQHRELTGQYEKLASAVVLLHDESHGRVIERGGRPVADYWMDESDCTTMKRGIHELARIFFAAGARAVYLPFDAGRPCLEHELTQRMADGRVEPHRLPMSSVHPQGSCPIGASPATSALNPYGQVWDTPGVYVADASVFPSSVGVPPQVAIMSLARLIADHVADELAA